MGIVIFNLMNSGWLKGSTGVSVEDVDFRWIRVLGEPVKRETSGRESSEDIEKVSDIVRGLVPGWCDSTRGGGDIDVEPSGRPRFKRLRGGPSSWEGSRGLSLLDHCRCVDT